MAHGHRDHAGNPEEDDIEAGHHHALVVNRTQRVGVFPASRGWRKSTVRSEQTVYRERLRPDLS